MTTHAAPSTTPGRSTSTLTECNSVAHDWGFEKKFPNAELLSCRDPLGIEEDDEGLYHSSLYVNRPKLTGSARYLLETIDGSGIPSDLRLVHIPGLSENVPYEFARNRTERLLGLLGLRRSITLGHNAIGIRGEHDTSNRVDVTLEREEIIRKSSRKDERNILLGSSMGSVILSDIALRNSTSKKPFNIAAQVYVAPAIRRDGGMTLPLAANFGRQLIMDGLRDTAFMGVRQQFHDAKVVKNWLHETSLNLHNLHHQVDEVLGASIADELALVVSLHPTVVIVGEKDKIADIPLWKELAASYPDTMRLVLLKNRGHEILTHPERTARKIAKELKEIGLAA